MPRLTGFLVAAALCIGLTVPASADAALRKALWGPVQDGVLSQFGFYEQAGADTFQMTLRWDEVAPRRPRAARSFRDRRYRWPAELSYALGEARAAGMDVAVTLYGTPRWANGGRSPRWAPRRTRDLADFAQAAARRYPAVRLWRVWEEPSRAAMFQPLVRERPGRPLNRRERSAPRRYARMLDATYRAIKRVQPRDLVVGGNTTTSGDISPRNWIRSLRLPNGRAPRMSLYGHNPYTVRHPRFGQQPLGQGHADFADLPLLARWVDRWLPGRRGTHRKLFLARFWLPSDNAPNPFGLSLTREQQADWLRAAVGQARRWKRVHTFAYEHPFDRPDLTAGLMDAQRRPKPALSAFRDG